MGSFLGLFSEDGVNMLYHAQLILVVHFNFPGISKQIVEPRSLGVLYWPVLTDHGVSRNVPCEMTLQTNTNNLDELF